MLAPEDLNAEWFTAVLQRRYPGVCVTDAEVTRAHEWTNVHAHVTLAYASASTPAPERVFVKLPPANAAKARALGSSRMGTQEALFYTHLAPMIDLRVPDPHGALIEEDGGFAIVIEDLRDTGCTPHNLIGVEPDAAAVALEDLARMHVAFEDQARRNQESASWIQAPRIPAPGEPTRPNLGQKLLRKGIEEQSERLGEAYVRVAERWISDGAWFQRIWWDAPWTVIHGDAHPGNLFDDHGRVGFLDWGLISLGDPLRDMSYFIALALALALDTEVRRRHERDLIRHYLEVRSGLGGRGIGFDEAWLRNRLHAAYTVPASCQALYVPADASPNARRFSDLFLERAIAAVGDLDVCGAIEAQSR